ncbi:prolyl 4-hydroxylase subunit alpha-1-like isoform X5 [Aricia agestis]|uniref:prolyl 4-hydroxylase subunit alpha-1-like isoform X5 n=1 Tax=Aricia agestis TaxID=91739 RepID=UPI001C201C06|nr:prolyl 4-hydroxylase subunit alpha-1-like isoform X5 [Aricia agestis]
MCKRKIFWCLVLINFGVFSRGELFSALSDLEPLLKTHKRVIHDLHDYISREEERLHILKSNNFSEHARSIGITQYENATYPSAEDLRGAARALTRLQETYFLKVEDLAEGILNGVIYSSKMSASDGYELAKILFNESDYQNSLDWMITALHKFKEENNSYMFEEIDILQYISLSYHFLGDHREALKWAIRMIELDPHHSDAIINIIKFQKHIEVEEAKLNADDEADKISDENNNVNATLEEIKAQFFSFSNALCRGEVEVPPAIAKELKCRYYNENSFLKLAPIKMEYKYHNPDIVIFYEVLSDEEIEIIKNIAQPRLKRALIYNTESKRFASAEKRISKSAWLVDKESPVVERVSRRVADFTGLNMDTAEDLQVVNYGIGGHYTPHVDYALPEHTQQFSDEVGNRIATVLFYMSDVAEGGATVFPKLSLSLFPVRGAAAVWFNLFPSGEGDRETAHAACPVLRGTKWVCNKWIHMVGQEFRRPCGLTREKTGNDSDFNSRVK